MAELFASLRESVDYLKAAGAPTPEVAIVLGSGLDGLAKFVEAPLEIPFSAIPHFAPSTVDFHAGQLVFGKLRGMDVVVLEGRLHYYEGHSMQQVVHPVRTLRLLGAESLILTCAVGGLNPSLKRGSIMAIDDHLNLMGDNPLIGPNDDRIGTRFPDMSEPYLHDYLDAVTAVAAAADIDVRRGVLAAMAGPCLETAAEYRFLRRIGADAVGMSTVPENIAAVHAGLKVLGLAVITDLCDPDDLKPVDVAEILRVAASAEPKLQDLVLGFLDKLNLRKGVDA
ncbi:MAG: purine-nucleoside phosphorylase [bacterium]|nr:purine-nucleoside phosphorylase [bacterium]